MEGDPELFPPRTNSVAQLIRPCDSVLRCAPSQQILKCLWVCLSPPGPRKEKLVVPSCWSMSGWSCAFRPRETHGVLADDWKQFEGQKFLDFWRGLYWTYTVERFMGLSRWRWASNSIGTHGVCFNPGMHPHLPFPLKIWSPMAPSALMASSMLRQENLRAQCSNKITWYASRKLRAFKQWNLLHSVPCVIVALKSSRMSRADCRKNITQSDMWTVDQGAFYSQSFMRKNSNSILERF